MNSRSPEALPSPAEPTSLLQRIADRDAQPFDAARFPILVPDLAQSILAVIDENLGQGGLRASDLDRITVPTSGATTFEIPSLDGDTEPAKSIVGIILLMAPAKGFWQTSIETGKTPPSCYSNDGLAGIGSPGGPCLSCPFNQWGSDTAGSRTGKACKDKQLLYVLQEQSALPVVLALPRTSVAINRKYMTRLSSTALPYYGCITSFTLERVKGSGVPDYSTVRPSYVEPIPRPQWPAIRQYAEALAQALKTSAQSMFVDAEPPSVYGPTADFQPPVPGPAPPTGDYDPFADPN
jgi:hypothetical protein